MWRMLSRASDSVSEDGELVDHSVSPLILKGIFFKGELTLYIVELHPLSSASICHAICPIPIFTPKPKQTEEEIKSKWTKHSVKPTWSTCRKKLVTNGWNQPWTAKYFSDIRLWEMLGLRDWGPGDYALKLIWIFPPKLKFRGDWGPGDYALRLIWIFPPNFFPGIWLWVRRHPEKSDL